MTKIAKMTMAIMLIGFISTASAESPTCAAVNEQEVKALFDRWNDSLKTHDPEVVAANYAPDAVLLPTVSNKPRTNHDEIKAYFVDFLKKDPQGTIDTRTIKIGCNIAQDVGTYTFSLKGGKKVAARYTYVYEYVGDKWLIAHHHSSAMPEVIASTHVKKHHHKQHRHPKIH